MSVADSVIVSRGELDTKEAQWIKLVKTTYKDPNGKSRTWESAERRTRPVNSETDGVGIIAILKKAGAPEIVLQKQFRPPAGKVCIEVPAGLIDAGETVEQCALRELKEETGYVGEIVEGGGGVSALMFNDPGFCNTNVNLVHVMIDMSRPENQNPVTHLEDNEFIETFSLPLTDLYKACKDFEKRGYAIDVNVGILAEGIEVAKRWQLT